MYGLQLRCVSVRLFAGTRRVSLLALASLRTMTRPGVKMQSIFSEASDVSLLMLIHSFRYSFVHVRRFEDMPPIPTLFGVIYGWLVMARGLAFEDVQKQEAYEQIDFHAFEKEIRAVEAACKAVDSPCVFAHNDLLSGNILIIQVSFNVRAVYFIRT